MSKKQPPPKSPESSEQPPIASLGELMDALAKVSARMQGTDVPQHVAEVREHVTTLVETLQQRGEPDEQARQAAAAEIERLIEAVAATGTAAGRAIEQQREPIKQAFAGVELASLAEGLHRFADWLANPTPEKQAEAQRVIEQLQRTLGPMVGFDPAAEDERRRAEIRAGVQQSLDAIFRPKKPE